MAFISSVKIFMLHTIGMVDNEFSTTATFVFTPKEAAALARVHLSRSADGSGRCSIEAEFLKSPLLLLID